MSMILAAKWVRRGVATEFPRKYEVDETELGRIEKLARLQLQDAKDDLEAAQHDADGNDDGSDSDDEDPGVSTGITNGSSTKATTNKDTDDDDMKEYNLSDYDEDEVDETGEKFAMFGNVRSLAYHQAGEEDPYLILPQGDDSDNEREELQILPTDNLILAAKVEDEVPHLEVSVYEDEEENIYVHHDIMLPAIPLCLEWLDHPVGSSAPQTTDSTTQAKKQGNFVAVGMMDPEIEIWDLDVVDSMYPTAILGQKPEDKEAEEDNTETSTKKSSKKKPKSKKKKKPKANPTHHVDAVLSLALNPHHRNLLASGSADKTLKLWDLNSGTCAKSYNMHAGKVTALDWHPSPDKSTILLSGSADDHTVSATDMRAPDAIAPKWTVEADVERVRWNPHDPNFFYVTTEAGTVHYFDSRTPPSSADSESPSKPVWTLQAHDGAVAAFDVNPLIPGFLVTGSDDKKVKLWSVQDNKPSMVVARNLEVGRVFSATFAPDHEVAFRLCVAGSKGQVQVWDTSTNPSVRKVFHGRAKFAEGENVKERIVGLSAGADDSEIESEDEPEEGGGGANGQEGGWESMEED